MLDTTSRLLLANWQRRIDRFGLSGGGRMSLATDAKGFAGGNNPFTAMDFSHAAAFAARLCVPGDR